MMRTTSRFKVAVFAFALVSSVLVGALYPGAIASAGTPAPAPTPGALTADDCSKRFLTFPTWFRGLVDVDGNNNCYIISPTDTPPGGTAAIGISNYVWKIVLNVIEIVLQLIGYLAVFFIIYGGFRFMTRGDNPSEVEAARKTIMNAVIGLVISMASIAIVNLIFRIF